MALPVVGLDWKVTLVDSAGLPLSGGAGLPVDTELPAAAVLGDTDANPTTPTVGAVNMLLVQGGTTVFRQKGHDGSLDARGTTIGGAVVQDYGYLWNEASWDRRRANTQAVIQASASTAAGTINTTITNFNGRSVLVFATVSSYGAAGTFLMKLQAGFGDAGATFVDIPGATTGTLTNAITGTPALIILGVGPTAWPANVTTGLNPAFYANHFLCRTLRVVTTVGANAVTYAQSYSLGAA